MKKTCHIKLEFVVESDSRGFVPPEGDPHAFLAGLLTGIIHNAVENYRRDGTHVVSWKYIDSEVLK